MSLRKSYEKMKAVYDETKLDFRGSEQQKREQFYQKYGFKEGLKAIDGNKSQPLELKRDEQVQETEAVQDIEKQEGK